MVFVSGFLYILAVLFFLKSWKSGSSDERVLAGVFLLAGLGSSLISFFALATINSL